MKAKPEPKRASRPAPAKKRPKKKKRLKKRTNKSIQTSTKQTKTKKRQMAASSKPSKKRKAALKKKKSPKAPKKAERQLSAKGRKEKKIATGVFIFILCLMPFAGLYAYRQYEARQQAANSQEEEEVETFADVYAVNEAVQIQNIQEAQAGSVVDAKGLSDESLRSLFTAYPLSDDQMDEMEEITIFPDQMSVPQEDLVYVRVLHRDFDGNDRVGELIVNKSIYVSVIEAFYNLYKQEYPIEKMVLLDEYDGSLALSLTDNNTSAFSMKNIEGKIVNDRRSQGLVIDINPFYNPQINESTDSVFPESSMIYQDRDVSDTVAKANHMITPQDKAYLAFTAQGFSWGGELVKDKQYQLFAYGKSEPLKQNNPGSSFKTDRQQSESETLIEQPSDSGQTQSSLSQSSEQSESSGQSESDLSQEDTSVGQSLDSLPDEQQVQEPEQTQQQDLSQSETDLWGQDYLNLTEQSWPGEESESTGLEESWQQREELY